MSGWEFQFLPKESAITWNTTLKNALCADFGPMVFVFCLPSYVEFHRLKLSGTNRPPVSPWMLRELLLRSLHSVWHLPNVVLDIFLIFEITNGSFCVLCHYQAHWVCSTFAVCTQLFHLGSQVLPQHRRWFHHHSAWLHHCWAEVLRSGFDKAAFAVHMTALNWFWCESQILDRFGLRLIWMRPIPGHSRIKKLRPTKKWTGGWEVIFLGKSMSSILYEAGHNHWGRVHGMIA